MHGDVGLMGHLWAIMVGPVTKTGNAFVNIFLAYSWSELLWMVVNVFIP